ncbi:MAG: hypothetical protein HOP19_06720 [Acidobacteria bacterium]|nr:hypothetical protein [Acidobacteriota bacterium]
MLVCVQLIAFRLGQFRFPVAMQQFFQPILRFGRNLECEYLRRRRAGRKKLNYLLKEQRDVAIAVGLRRGFGCLGRNGFSNQSRQGPAGSILNCAANSPAMLNVIEVMLGTPLIPGNKLVTKNNQPASLRCNG